MSDEVGSGVGTRKGWPHVFVGGVVLGLLASFPSLDGVLWRFVLFVAPWLALIVVPLAAVGVWIVFGKGRGW